jgi:geranyl-CoA carboxylase alpha subunit
MKARPFFSVLVANRGEIALRVIEEARQRDFTAIAVHSSADADMPFVRAADLSVCIGPAPAAQSYLNIEAILDAARRTGAEAIHPGYGFLSENAAFARAVLEAGLVWIGPPPDAIEAMGDKAKAKTLMIEAGVPTLPGWQGEDQSEGQLKARADEIGYPLLIKAVAGGGGRGMRVVRSADGFEDALVSARREAKSAFGDETVLLEKYVERGRHVEVQVFADTHGHTIHLGERDCSAQRRRQKVIEEAPSPSVDEALRQRMGEAAVAAAKAVGYVGAGTVEFLLDESGAFYFLEMNTRLQVEHPVTESVVGLNLVQLQFDVAAGAPLPREQGDIEFHGHAIEARLYAEDPSNGFAPQSGPIALFEPRTPYEDRVDAGVETGDVIGTDYDPMVAKFISWGQTREEAIDRLRASLMARPLLGVKTNRDFLLRLLDNEAFRTGKVCVADLDQWSEAGSGPFAAAEPPDMALALAALLMARAPGEAMRAHSVRTFGLDLELNGQASPVLVTQARPDTVEVTAGEQSWQAEYLGGEGALIDWRLDGIAQRTQGVCLADGSWWLALGDQIVTVREASPWGPDAEADPSKITAPVSGTVVAVNVKPGQAVKAGDVLAVMEAMKMEMRLTAEADGVVSEVHASEASQAASGTILIELDLQTQD